VLLGWTRNNYLYMRLAFLTSLYQHRRRLNVVRDGCSPCLGASQAGLLAVRISRIVHDGRVQCLVAGEQSTQSLGLEGGHTAWQYLWRRPVRSAKRYKA
jgi:hypothetical protein